jgi:hypothetical protein
MTDAQHRSFAIPQRFDIDFRIAELMSGGRLPCRDFKVLHHRFARQPAAEFALPAIVRAQFLIQCPDAYTLFPNLVLGTDPLTGGGPAT